MYKKILKIYIILFVFSVMHINYLFSMGNIYAGSDVEEKRVRLCHTCALTAWEVFLEASHVEPDNWRRWREIPPFNARTEEELLVYLYDLGKKRFESLGRGISEWPLTIDNPHKQNILLTAELKEDWYIREILTHGYLTHMGYIINNEIALESTLHAHYLMKPTTLRKVQEWLNHLGIAEGPVISVETTDREFLNCLESAWSKTEQRRGIKVKFDNMHQRALLKDYIPPPKDFISEFSLSIKSTSELLPSPK